MNKLTDNELKLLKELRELTKKKDTWESEITNVAKILYEIHSPEITAKVLWLLGEMGLKYPTHLPTHIEKIARYFEHYTPKLRERAVNAIGRIGRADSNLILPYFNYLLEMINDEYDNVRLSFVWACENIATNTPELFTEKLNIFYDLLQDNSEKVRIEAPEMFRVMGKRKPKSVEPYLERLQWFADNDHNKVVRIHCAGAIRITKKTLTELNVIGKANHTKS